MDSIGSQPIEIPVSDEKPNTRPLNSFFAYRAYYTAIFSVIQQKERSGLLTQLWKAPDPFKTKWAIIAKAYSIIRGLQGKTLSNVQEFLSFTAPFMNIIEPEHYLEQLGYVLYAPDNDHGYTMVKEKAAQYDVALTGSDKSLLDLVKNAVDHGYVQVNKHAILKKAASESILMLPGGRNNPANFPDSNDGPEVKKIDLEAFLALVPEATAEEIATLAEELKTGRYHFMPPHEDRPNGPTIYYDVENELCYDLEFLPGTENMFLNPYPEYRFNAYNIQELHSPR